MQKTNHFKLGQSDFIHTQCKQWLLVIMTGVTGTPFSRPAKKQEEKMKKYVIHFGLFNRKTQSGESDVIITSFHGV